MQFTRRIVASTMSLVFFVFGTSAHCAVSTDTANAAAGSDAQTAIKVDTLAEVKADASAAVKVDAPAAQAADAKSTTASAVVSNNRPAFDAHASHALVSIRFPALYETSAIDAINGTVRFKKIPSENVSQLVNEQVVKSTYFAAEFYHHLKSRLPEKSVVLVPTRISADKDGKIAAEPLSKAIPTVLTVDFYSYISPERIKANASKRSLFSSDDTYGNRLKIYANVYKTGPHGEKLLVAGPPLFNKKANKYGLSLVDFYNESCKGNEPKLVAKVDQRDVVSKLPIQDGAFFNLPRESTCSGKVFKLHVSKDEAASPALFDKLWSTYSDVLVSYLNAETKNISESTLIGPYVGDIDPLLKAKLATGVEMDPKLSRQVAFMKSYLEKERTELYIPLSERACESIFEGEFGNSVRALLKSELDYHKKYVSSKRRGVAASFLSAAATAGSIATSLTVPSYGIGSLLSALAIAGAAIACNESKLQNELTKFFKDYETEATGVQRAFMVKFEDQVIEVNGDSIAKLRETIKDRYNTLFQTTEQKEQTAQAGSTN